MIKHFKTVVMALTLCSLSLPSFAQTAVTPNNNNINRTPPSITTTTQSPAVRGAYLPPSRGGEKVHVYGADLINAEAAVATARGECRSFSRQPKADGTQRTRPETSQAYQGCMMAKEQNEATATSFIGARQ